MDVLYRITLRRPDGRMPWGFRLRGGQESGESLTFREICPSSISDHCGIRVGDQLVALAGNLTQNMNNAEVQDVIMRAGNVLEIIVERPNRELGDYTRKYQQNRNTTSSDIRCPWPPTTDTFNHPIDSNKPFSEDYFNYRSTNKGRRYTSPPLKFRTFASSIRPYAASDTEEYTGISIPGSKVRSNYRNLLDANLGLQPNWSDEDDDDDDLIDKSRKVRFAEPPESKVIELESMSSYVPSIDWDFTEGTLHPWRLQNFKLNKSDNTPEVVEDNFVDSLTKEMDNIDLENYFPKMPFGEFEKTFSPPKKEWPYGNDNYPFTSNLYYDTFPRSSKKKKIVDAETDQKLFQIKNLQPFKSFEENRRFENLSGNQNIFDSQHFASVNLPKNFDSNMNRDIKYNQFSSDQMRFHPPSSSSAASLSSPLISGKFKMATPPQNEFPDKPASTSQATQRLSEMLDPTKTGLFAMLDRSVTDKIMNWNRPLNLEQSATYKLLKELEKNTNPEYDYK